MLKALDYAMDVLMNTLRIMRVEIIIIIFARLRHFSIKNAENMAFKVIISQPLIIAC